MELLGVAGRRSHARPPAPLGRRRSLLAERTTTSRSCARHDVEPDGEARRVARSSSSRAAACGEVGGLRSRRTRIWRRPSPTSSSGPGVVRGSFDAGVPGAARGGHDDRHAHAPEVPAGARPSGLLPHFVAVMDNARGPQGLHRQGQRVGLERAARPTRGFFYEEDVRSRRSSRGCRSSRGSRSRTSSATTRQKTAAVWKSSPSAIAQAGPPGSRRGRRARRRASPRPT